MLVLVVSDPVDLDRSADEEGLALYAALRAEADAVIRATLLEARTA